MAKIKVLKDDSDASRINLSVCTNVRPLITVCWVGCQNLLINVVFVHMELFVSSEGMHLT